ncbi:MAG: hypothetical protein WC389_21670 [Lutibacter sp.]
MLTDISVDKNFRLQLAKELNIEMPDDHLEDIKNDFDLSMLKEIDETEKEKQEYINNLEENE